MKHISLLILAPVALLGSPPQGDGTSAGSAATANPTVITVEANDFSLALPGTVPAGMKAFTDRGAMPHW